MKQHLVILCNNLKEAVNAAVVLPTYKDVKKFYVFNFDLDKNATLNWMNNDDDYIALGKVSELGNSAEICIRAAILYVTNWWHLIFCYAHDLPSISELNNVKAAIDLNQGFVQNSKTWAVSKEHLLLFGLSKILGSGMVADEKETLKNELEIVKALRGEAASYEAIVEAFIECVNIEGMVLQGKMPNYKTKAKEFIEHMTDKFSIIPEDPGVIFVSPEISNNGFKMLIDKIGPRTMVCAIDEKDKTYPQVPYKELNCNNEFFIKIFTKGG
jgi:hypothetical protein